MSDAIIGFVGCLIAGLLFGVMFVPVKKYDASDGLFVQWVVCCAIFIVGFVINIIRGAPQFYHLAMVGGALWATGNVMAIPVIDMIGMGLGMMLWSSSCLLAGWASARFGWFGMSPQIPMHPWLNYLGVTFSVFSAVMFAFVKSSGSSKTNVNPEQQTTDKCLSDKEDDEAEIDGLLNYKANMEEKTKRFSCTVPPAMVRIIGIAVALLSGIFYGLTFAPVIFIQDHRNDSTNYPEYVHATNNGLDYVFAHFTGIFITATLFFLIYCIVKRNRPVMNPEIVLPAFVAGTMWSVAQSAFFVANDKLSSAITFPIITRLPGCVAALFGIFYFREITGKKNLLIMFLATCITVIAGVLSGISNTEF